MSTTKHKDDVAQADAEANEAQELVEALEERVRDGDESVTVEQVESQRGLSRFARLRAEAARRKAQRQRDAEHRAQVDELAAEIAAHKTANLVKLHRDAEHALDAFVAACEEHNAWLKQTTMRMRQLQLPDVKHREDDPSGLAYDVGAGGAVVVTNDGAMSTVKTGSYVLGLVEALARRRRELVSAGRDLAMAVAHTGALNGSHLERWHG